MLVTDQIDMTIDGAAASVDASFEVLNPATEQVVGLAPDCSPAHLEKAMSAAQTAFGSWRQDLGVRRTALEAIADVVATHVDDLAAVLTAEQGKPLHEARREVLRTSDWFRHYAQVALDPEVVQDDATARVDVVRRPLGVTVAITPWNVPLALAAWKIAPALLTGNTVIVKPSPYTPLATLAMVALTRDLLPPGVLSALSGGDELGKAMTSHPIPRKLSFTGSAEAGASVLRASVPDFKRVTLELGGNDAAIVLDDVDVAAVAERIFWSGFSNAGQVCCAVKRVYVPRHLESALVDSLADLARSVVVGDGAVAGTQIGPLNNAEQRDRVSMLVDAARFAGADVVAGGAALDRPGYFYQPTIVRNLPQGSALVEQEQFGPALPVVAYDRIEDAVAASNGGKYGLSGSVWSGDATRAAEVGSSMDCGTVWVNTHGMLNPWQPFGGHKASGLGLENGRWGLDAFTDIQVRYTPR